MSRCDEAISASEADRAFTGLRRFNHLLLAVSGGPDSLALLYLIAEWHGRVGSAAPAISVATVDHGLRAESAAEADIVAQHCAALNLSHATMSWHGAKPKRGIPNAARAARYALLDDHARKKSESGSIAVVTAHHQDDQAETLFMRLARGGGVDALSAMASDRSLASGSPVRLVRPLLGFSKARLIASLAARRVRWLDDPTNTDLKFERARVRQSLAASGLSSAALAVTARRMQDAGVGLDYATARFKETLALSLHGGIYARLDRPVFDAGPSILRHRVLTELIGRFGGSTAKPELSEIESLLARIDAAKIISATLGGTVISADPRTISIWRELGRLSNAGLALTAGEVQLWDDRFWVSYDGPPETAVTVRPLGLDGIGTIADLIPDAPPLPFAAMCGLPSFWADATLLAVPQLNFEAASCAVSGLMLNSAPVFMTCTIDQLGAA